MILLNEQNDLLDVHVVIEMVANSVRNLLMFGYKCISGKNNVTSAVNGRS